jgi:hypothetical protein
MYLMNQTLKYERKYNFIITDVPFRTEQCYDVADMLKQYFRELPEPLLTNKLSESFIGVHTCKKIQS